MRSLPLYKTSLLSILACLTFVQASASAQTTASPLVSASAVRFKASVKSEQNVLLKTDTSVKVGELANGLKYYIKPNAHPKQKVELRLVVKAGSVEEDDDQRGVAHFVEHMAFNGSRHFPGNSLVDALRSIGLQFGADLNATTHFDHTAYLLPVPTGKKRI